VLGHHGREVNTVGVGGHRVLLLKGVLVGLLEDHAVAVIYDLDTLSDAAVVHHVRGLN